MSRPRSNSQTRGKSGLTCGYCRLFSVSRAPRISTFTQDNWWTFMSAQIEPRAAAARQSAMHASRRMSAMCAAFLCIVSACAVGPNFHHPDPPAVTHYTHGTDPVATAAVDGTAQQFHTGGVLAGDWWRLFQSTKLDAV